MKKIVLLAWMILCIVWSANALSTAAGDNSNTNVPQELVKVVAAVYHGGYAIISSNLMIGAGHTAAGIYPGLFATNCGISYPVESVFFNTNRDQAIIKIAGNFPADAIVEMANPSDLQEGVGIILMGSGAKNWKEVYRQEIVTLPKWPLLISNLVRGQTNVHFEVVCTNSAQFGFVVEQTTNPVTGPWLEILGTYTATQSVAPVSLSCNPAAPMNFYRTRSVSCTITNQLLIGWEKSTNTDWIRRWATNTIAWVGEWAFTCYFDRDAGPDEGCTMSGDSSDPCLIQIGGKYLLAGCNTQSSSASPLSQDGGATWFYGAMFDRAGLLSGQKLATGEIQPSFWFDSGRVQPTGNSFTRVDHEWVGRVMNGQVEPDRQ